MQFHVGKGEFIVIPRYTACHKPSYTQKMRAELDGIASRQAHSLGPGDFWVFVDLSGLRRTIRRSHLYTKAQYDDAREKDRAALGTLRAKSGRIVGEDRALHGVDCPAVAAEDSGECGTGPDV